MTTTQAIDVTTPVGRIVWGNPLNAQEKRDFNTKQLKIGNDGQPIKEWVFGLAINKNDPGVGAIFTAMQQAAGMAYPNGAVPANFAYKYKDGDTENKEGTNGCWVFTVATSAFPPPVMRLGQGGAYQQITEGLKTGDYVRVGLGIRAHNSPGNPGLYLNPTLIEYVGIGDAIINGPSAAEVFGGQPVALPPGATPLGAANPTAPMAAPPVGAQPGLPPAAPVQQQPQGGAAPMPGMPGQPGVAVPLGATTAAVPLGATTAAVPQQPPVQPAMHSASPVAMPAQYPSNPQQPPAYQPAPDFVQNAVGQQYAQPGQPGAAPMPGLPGQPVGG